MTKLIDNSKYARRKLLEEFFEDSVVVSYKKRGINLYSLDLDCVEMCKHCKDDGYTGDPYSYEKKVEACSFCQKGVEFKRSHSINLKVGDNFDSH